MVPDELRREVVVGASRERAWQAITDPDLLAAWFPTQGAEIDLRPGGRARFSWDDSIDEAIIDVVEPQRRLVFRWRPEGLARPYTTVSFTLADETGGGTRVTLVEAGFASLPDQIHQQSRHGNDAGWAEELAELKAYLEAA